jgi:hypothetical protein
MIAELVKILPDFSQVNHTRCFLHIVNLCAKSIIKQFDVPKKKEDEHLDEAVRELQDDNDELQDLAGDQELEEQQTVDTIAQHQINGQDGEEEEEDDGIEGWIDEMELLSPAERAGLEESIRPVKLVLVKVSCRID